MYYLCKNLAMNNGTFLSYVQVYKVFFSKSLLHVLLMFWLMKIHLPCAVNALRQLYICLIFTWPFTLGSLLHLQSPHLFPHSSLHWAHDFYLDSSRKSLPWALKQCSLASGLLGSWLPPSLLALAKSNLFHSSSMTMDLGNRNKVSSCPGTSYFVLLLVFGSSGELYSIPISMPSHFMTAGAFEYITEGEAELVSLSFYSIACVPSGPITTP